MKPSVEWCGCPIRFGASVVGDPWALVILRDLMFHKARHYADFLQAGEGISTNILANRLAWLESEGVLHKSRDPENGTRFLYHLTEKGRDLVPVLLELMAWSGKWDAATEMSAEFQTELASDRPALIRRIQQSFEPKPD